MVPALMMAPRKKRKDTTSAGTQAPSNAQRAVRLQRGSLQDLPDFAIEIQLEVFSNLHPRDLLKLARTCKKFRAFFLHRSNERLWHAARDNVGNLPPCPPCMSEPAFINLLFGTCCQNCGQINVRKVAWVWFVRYCPRCVVNFSYSLHEARTQIIIVDLQAPIASKDTLFDLFGRHYVSDLRSCEHYRFRKSQVDAFVQALDRLPKPITNEARSQLFATQNTRTAALSPVVRRCEEWYITQEEERAADLEAKRKERFTEITRRLKGMGWTEEIELLDRQGIQQMANLPVVRQSSKLTPKAWENVLKVVDPFLKRKRQGRLDKEHCDVLRLRLAALDAAILAHYVKLPRAAHMDVRPDVVDLALTDEGRALADAPNHVIVTQEEFARVIPNLCARWEQERREEATEALREHLGALPDDVDPLGLAVAIFPCTHCLSDRNFAFYRYPTILSHPCAHERDLAYKSSHDCTADLYQITAARSSRKIWPGGYPRLFPFSFSHVCGTHTFLRSVFDRTSKIIEALGFDPKRTTAQELQACTVRLVCTRCMAQERNADGTAEPTVTYAWEAALHHSWARFRDIHDEWRLADSTIDEAVDNAEGVHTLQTPGAVWACSLCVRWENDRYGYGGVQEHLHQKHGLTYSDDCIKDGTIYLHPGKSSVLMRPYITST
ncbi:hypothetical protein C8Q74DRAFT_569448 [Fomes fomentarius]|nr:hypothetical protein C8Q74DRAFT_569448 [Fomes fomentarius]